MRSVLFVDPPAFCTTLEGLVEPGLRSRPLAIAPPAADRAPILALSSEARLSGLVPGMPIRTAQRICPDLVVLPPNPELYARASRALHDILRIFAPTIEPKGYGHSFLDLTGTDRLFGPPQDVADRIRQESRDRLRLPVTVGIATNKLVSQAAIRADRRAGGWADGGLDGRSTELVQVAIGGEREFLAPQPLEVFPELEPRIRMRLEDYQLELIGEVAAISESALCAVFGRHGPVLRARARGIDPRPVLSPEQQSEFRVVHTFAGDTNDLGVLHPMLRLMSERLGRRLRRRELTAGRLRLEVTYADYTSAARAVPIAAAVLDSELRDAARRALSLATTKRLAVRSVSLTLDRLMKAEAQLELWDGQRDSGTAGQRDGTQTEPLFTGNFPAPPLSRCPAALQHAIDEIRTRYGTGALRDIPLTAHRSPLTPYHTTTIFPKVALPSRTRWASASSVIG